MYSNGTIVFSYLYIPDNVIDVADKADHDVKAGISDSFYLRQTG